MQELEKYYIVEVFRSWKEAERALKEFAAMLDQMESSKNHRVSIMNLRAYYEEYDVCSYPAMKCVLAVWDPVMCDKLWS